MVQAAQADPARFLELYDRCFYRVWAFVIRRTANRADAEDVTSEVFRRALENLGAYDPYGPPFAAWLFRIASNALADRWAKAAREAPVSEAALPPEQAQPDADLERHAMLFQLVGRLPLAQRRVIELRFVEGKSLQETGAELGKSEGAIKQLQKRALDNLRAQLEDPHA